MQTNNLTALCDHTHINTYITLRNYDDIIGKYLAIIIGNRYHRTCVLLDKTHFFHFSQYYFNLNLDKLLLYFHANKVIYFKIVLHTLYNMYNKFYITFIVCLATYKIYIFHYLWNRILLRFSSYMDMIINEILLILMVFCKQS